MIALAVRDAAGLVEATIPRLALDDVFVEGETLRVTLGGPDDDQHVIGQEVDLVSSDTQVPAKPEEPEEPPGPADVIEEEHLTTASATE